MPARLFPEKRSTSLDLPVQSRSEDALKGIAKADREDGEERCVAKVMVVARYEGGEVLLEPRVLINRFTPDCLRLRGIARAATEADLQSRLPNVVESGFYRDAEVAPGARDDIPKPKRKAGRSLAKID